MLKLLATYRVPNQTAIPPAIAAPAAAPPPEPALLPARKDWGAFSQTLLGRLQAAESASGSPSLPPAPVQTPRVQR